MAPPSAPRRELLLRHRFETLAQVREHLHVQEGRSLFYFRHTGLEAEGGDRALLEISTSEQQMLLRGTVVSRDVSGFWLDFPDGRLAKRLADGGLAQRRQRRVPMDLMVEIRSRTSRVGRILDVSMGGARLGGAQGLVAGQEVELRLLSPLPEVPSSLGRAEVLRAGAGEAAVRFVRSDLSTRVAATKLLDAAQKAWARSVELPHAPGCCGKSGILFEPPTPRLRSSGGGVVPRF
jgi:hypothetical protein